MIGQGRENFSSSKSVGDGGRREGRVDKKRQGELFEGCTSGSVLPAQALQCPRRGSSSMLRRGSDVERQRALCGASQVGLPHTQTDSAARTCEGIRAHGLLSWPERGPGRFPCTKLEGFPFLPSRAAVSADSRQQAPPRSHAQSHLRLCLLRTQLGQVETTAHAVSASTRMLTSIQFCILVILSSVFPQLP